MEDMYELDTAYCDGFEDGSSGNINSNPYDPKKDVTMFEEYKKGYYRRDGGMKWKFSQ